MSEQAFLNPAILSFIAEKATNFISGLAVEKVSSSSFERELRSTLSDMDDQIDNIEGLIYQSKIAFEKFAQSMSEKSGFIHIDGVNIFGDLVICVNYNGKQTTAYDKELEDHFWQDKIKREFEQALALRDRNIYTELPEPKQEVIEQPKKTFSVRDMVRQSDERIRKAREED